MRENVIWGQMIKSTYSRYLIFEIADKNPVLKLAIDLVASFGAGSHRACAAIFDDADFFDHVASAGLMKRDQL
jgi:hypothetical protein